MTYKSNRQARAEYRENEAKNHERYVRDYARRKASRKRGSLGRIALVFLGLILFVWYLSHRSPRVSPSISPASYRH